ncbi:MAG: hypothetical protein ABI865_07235 [Nitrosospira sp.]
MQDFETKQEVEPKFALLRQLGQIAVTGNNYPYIRRARDTPAQRRVVLILKKSQQGNLRFWRQRIDFIQEKRSALVWAIRPGRFDWAPV